MRVVRSRLRGIPRDWGLGKVPAACANVRRAILSSNGARRQSNERRRVECAAKRRAGAREEIAGVCVCRGVAIDGEIASEVGRLAVKLNVLADRLAASDGWLVRAHWFAQARRSEIKLGLLRDRDEIARRCLISDSGMSLRRGEDDVVSCWTDGILKRIPQQHPEGFHVIAAVQQRHFSLRQIRQSKIGGSGDGGDSFGNKAQHLGRLYLVITVLVPRHQATATQPLLYKSVCLRVHV